MTPEFAARLDRQLAAELPDLDRAERGRRIETTVDFLRVCAAHPGTLLAPSVAVDEVFHTMVLDTAHYRKFCTDLGVPYIEHLPVLPGDTPSVSVSETVDFMTDCGFSFDGVSDLWPRNSVARCCGGCVPA